MLTTLTIHILPSFIQKTKDRKKIREMKDDVVQYKVKKKRIIFNKKT